MGRTQVRSKSIAKSRQPKLKIILLGRAAANALELLKPKLAGRAKLLPFPVSHETPEVLRELPDADIVVGNFFTERMARAARKLRLLQAPNAGVDAFALKSIPHETAVTNAYFHGPGIAEYVWMMILALSRDLLNMDRKFRRGCWEGSWIEGLLPRDEVLGKTLGLVGFGTIGREIAARAPAFGMNVRVISAHPKKQKPRGVESWQGPHKLDDLLKLSDYLVLACPLNEQTQGMIGPRQFRLMKRTAFLINVARGGVVQEEALYRALKSNRIGGAAIDVWYRYPKNGRPCLPSRLPFHKLSNTIMTPHVSGWSRGTREKRFGLVIDNIERLISGKPLLNVIQGPRRGQMDQVGSHASAS